jgi:hypothetical protein
MSEYYKNMNLQFQFFKHFKYNLDCYSVFSKKVKKHYMTFQKKFTCKKQATNKSTCLPKARRQVSSVLACKVISFLYPE